jgi:hypothetical protein
MEFIEESRKRGFEDQTIRNALIQKGWPITDIDSAFRFLDKGDVGKSYFKQKGVQKMELKNRISVFLDDELLTLLDKRAKKNMMTLSEQIEDILRRSTINQKGKRTTSEKLDDTLVGVFSRKNTGPKKKRKKKKN